MGHPGCTLGRPGYPPLLLLLLLFPLLPFLAPAAAGDVETMMQELGHGGVVGVLAAAAGGLHAEPLDLFGAKGPAPGGDSGSTGGSAGVSIGVSTGGSGSGSGDGSSGEGQGGRGTGPPEEGSQTGGAGASEGSADTAPLELPFLPQRAFLNHSSLGFASFSSYRLASTYFVVVGHSLTDRILGTNVTDLTCEWHYTDTGGTPQVEHGTVHADAPALKWGPRYPYYLMLLFCQLDKAPASEGAQAETHLRLNLGGYAILARPEHSRLLANVEPGEAPGTPPRELLAFCGPPMFRTRKYPSLSPYGIPQWVRYHQHVVGYDKMYFYDAAALPDGAREALKGDIDSGVIDITDFSGEKLYYAWADGQLLAMHDCLFRNRGVAAWVSYADFDEYLQVKALPAPFQSLRGFLQWAADDGYSQVTHGCMIFHLLCEEGRVEPLWGPQQSKFAVELLPFRGEVPYCTDKANKDPNRCRDWLGHRKYFANPLKLGSVKVHSVRAPQSVHYPTKRHKAYWFSAAEVHHAHYHGLLKPNTECTTLDKVTGRLSTWDRAPESRLVTDTAVAAAAEAARECAARGKDSGHQCPAWAVANAEGEK